MLKYLDVCEPLLSLAVIRGLKQLNFLGENKLLEHDLFVYVMFADENHFFTVFVCYLLRCVAYHPCSVASR